MRCVLFSLVLMCVPLYAARSAETRDYIGLNYQCSVSNGAVSITPSSEQIHYPVSGPPQRDFQYCANGATAWNRSGGFMVGCFSRSISNYLVNCTGGRIPGDVFLAGLPPKHRDKAMSIDPVLVPHQGGIAAQFQSTIVPFPRGYAPYPTAARLLKMPWDSKNDIVAFEYKVTAPLPDKFTLANAAPAWLKMFSNLAPWLEVLMAALIIPFFAIAAFGFYKLSPGQSSTGKLAKLACALAISLYAIVQLTAIPVLPEQALSEANAALADQKARLANVGALRSDVYRMMHDASGNLVPINTATANRLAEISSTLVITPPVYDPPNAVVLGIAALSAIAVSMAMYALNFAAGFHYLFRAPPIVDVVNAAIKRGEPLNTKRAAAALKLNLNEAHDPPPAYKSASDALHANELAERVKSMPQPRTAGSVARKQAYDTKVNAFTRLTRTLVSRREQEVDAATPPPIPAEDPRLTEARRKREEALREFEDIKRQLNSQNKDST